jgi:hypothetical protein
MKKEPIEKRNVLQMPQRGFENKNYGLKELVGVCKTPYDPLMILL